MLAAAPFFAKKPKAHKYAIKSSKGEVMALGKFKDGKELPAPAADSLSQESDSSAEAADNPSPDKSAADSSIAGEAGSRYMISAIEAPNEGQNYYITKDENNEFSFVQKLSWSAVKDIKNYRITIQRKNEDGEWTQVLEKDLFENKIELSLAAGTYRFQVGVVNLFDQLEKSTEWKNFEVLKATQPKIEAMQTESLVLNSKKADGVFTIEGENLTPNTKFTMEQKEAEPPKVIQGTILSVESDGKSAQVMFDFKEADEGKYEIYAQNPGGLSVISKSITIKNKKERNWRFLASAGYTLPLTFFDGTFNKFTERNFYPIAATTRMEVISFHTKAGDFGLGMGGSYLQFSNETDKMSMSGRYANALGYLVWQKYLIPQKLCLDLHVGAGAGLLFDTKFVNKAYQNYGHIESKNMMSLALVIGGGLTVQYHFAKHFFVEGGVDFVNAKFGSMNLGMFYPSISIGGMF